MKWKIEGAWKDSGDDAELVVEAPNAQAAQAIAAQKGLLVASVVPVGGAVPYASAPVIINNPEPSRSVSGLGIAALVLGIISCLFAWVPFVGVVSLPISLIGLLLGVIGIIIAASTKRQSMAMAVAGSIVCVVAVGLVVTMTVLPVGAVMTAAGSAAQTPTNPPLFSVPSIASSSPGQQPTPAPEAAEPTPESPADPAVTEPEPTGDTLSSTPDPMVVDASQTKSVQVQDVELTLEGVWQGNAAFDKFGDRVTSAGTTLMIDVTIKNLSSTRRLSYVPWMGDPMFGGRAMTLRDEHDNLYRRITLGFGTFPLGGVEDRESINPGVGLRDRLVFEAPIDAANRLVLRLPLSAVDREGEVVFEIPRSMISRSPPPRL